VPIVIFVRAFVAVVICAVSLMPAGASAAGPVPRLLRDASRAAGFPVRGTVRTSKVSSVRYDRLFSRAWDREYPSALRETDASVYRAFGLVSRSVKAQPARAWYDVGARRLFVQRRPAAGRRTIVHEYVRALIDQNFKLRRLVGLRTRDRDRCAAVDPGGPGCALRRLEQRRTGRNRAGGRATQSGRFERRPHANFDFVAVLTFSKVAAGDGFSLGVYITGDQMPIVRQAFGHHQGAVAGEHADFENTPRAGEPHEHFQELPLKASDLHLRILHLSKGLFTQSAEQFGLRFRVIVRILLDGLIYEIHRSCLLCAGKCLPTYASTSSPVAYLQVRCRARQADGVSRRRA